MSLYEMSGFSCGGRAEHAGCQRAAACDLPWVPRRTGNGRGRGRGRGQGRRGGRWKARAKAGPASSGCSSRPPAGAPPQARLNACGPGALSHRLQARESPTGSAWCTQGSDSMRRATERRSEERRRAPSASRDASRITRVGCRADSPVERNRCVWLELLAVQPVVTSVQLDRRRTRSTVHHAAGPHSPHRAASLSFCARIRNECVIKGSLRRLTCSRCGRSSCSRLSSRRCLCARRRPPAPLQVQDGQ